MSEEQVAEAPVEEAGQAPSVDTAAPSTPFDFRQHIDEEYLADPTIASFKDINSMAKTVINGQKLIGADKIPIPGKAATDDDWNMVYDKLGRPAEPSGYKLEANDLVDADGVGWFAETAHQIGLSETQANKLFGMYAERMTSSIQEIETHREKLHAELDYDLKQRYGDEGAKRVLSQANSVLEEFGASEMTEVTLQDGTKLGEHPQFINALINIAEFMDSRLGEDKFSGRDSEPGVSNAQLEQERASLLTQGSAYYLKDHPDHDRAVTRVNQLFNLLGPLRRV